jgi:predicted membrane channel-forming protein YqfA (hemolysin III family)
MYHHYYTIMSEGDYCTKNWWRICLVILCSLLIVGSIITMVYGMYYNDSIFKMVGSIVLAVSVVFGMSLIILLNKISDCGQSNDVYPVF